MKNNWLNNKSKELNATSGKDYIRLNAGLLRADELNSFLNSVSALSFVDKDKKMRYYKQPLNLHYNPDEIGQNWGSNFADPEETKRVNEIFDKLKNGENVIYQSNPDNTKDHFVVDSYRTIQDEKGKFLGVGIESQDIYPLVKFYLNQTGQMLTNDPNNEVKIQETDTNTGASEEWT